MAASQEQSSRPGLEAVSERRSDNVAYLRAPLTYGGGYDIHPIVDGIEVSVFRFTNTERFGQDCPLNVTLSLRSGGFRLQHTFKSHNARLIALALLQACDDADAYAVSLLTRIAREEVPA